jgi:phage gpG-like protein
MLINTVMTTQNMDFLDKEPPNIPKGLKKAGVIIQRRHKTKEFKRGGKNIMTSPVDPYYLTRRTGELSRSYTILFPDRLTMAYGSDKDYAPVHEFGSRMKNIPPRPTLARAVKATEEKVAEALADEIDKGL